MAGRKPFDVDAYIHRTQNAPCYICEMVTGRLNGNQFITQDNTPNAFLNIYPMLYGYTLVAPAAPRR